MSKASTLDIHLLLARHDDHLPVLGQALDSRSTAREPRPSIPRRRDLAIPLAERDDLSRRGWGVILPPGERGDRLLELVAPLVEMRTEEQGSEVAIIRSPPSARDVSLLEAVQWHETWSQSQPTRALPYYLLVVGGLDDVPLAVQRALSVTGNHAVGRVYFDRDDDYQSYAHKLRNRAKARPYPGLGDVLLEIIKDGTQATGDGHRYLFTHLLEGVRANHGGTPDQVREGSPRLEELCNALARITRPSVLFTLGQGEGPPRGGWTSSEAQRAYQGALGFGRGQRLAGADVAGRAFLPGGVWLMHSGFSMGTPLWSSYLGWLEKATERGVDADAIRSVLASRPIDDTPFLAALPKAALANELGPLAIVGHVDLVWSHSFPEPVDAHGSRSQALVAFMTALARGQRVGSSMGALFDYLNHVDSYLVSLYRGQEDDGDRTEIERERALYWLLREELASYILLGDPAARLAVEPPVTEASAGDEPAGHATANARTRLERAIADHILGRPASVALARHDLGADLNEERFLELARMYREAGSAALDENG